METEELKLILDAVVGPKGLDPNKPIPYSAPPPVSNPELYKDDASLRTEFYMGVVDDVAASEKAGRPIKHDAPYIRIFIPGDKSTIIDTPVNAHYAARFPVAYAAFMAGQQQQAVGTPLEAWPLIERSMVEELRYFQIRTVEHLAALRDDVCLQIRQGFELKRKAQNYLEVAAKNAPLEQMQGELKQRDAKIEALESTVAKLGEKVASDAPKPFKPRTRKRAA